MPRYLFIPRRRRGLLAMLSFTLLAAVGGAVLLSNSPQQDSSPAPPTTAISGPPWLYGSSTARFTLVVYADFECPYCQAYIPQLMRWVKSNPDVALQWHHLPLAAHEPAASREAQLAECFAETGSAPMFWEAVEWIYGHTRGNGQGVAESSSPPGLSTATQACMKSEQAAAIVRTQTEEATAAGITATPTLRLLDGETGRTLKLEGAVDDDVLLSALDWLSSVPIVNDEESTPLRMPVEDVSDTTR
ncbi:DsbA family protein [Pseudomonas sp. SBT1-2]|uniref:DsbA family protein n=1 Tax=Pseudomonas sp. SBT1-2 TaxID=3027852 RepID=UPI002361EB5C|nr:DsbA family protein [Pseudomonas sp. SBT1-2]